MGITVFKEIKILFFVASICNWYLWVDVLEIFWLYVEEPCLEQAYTKRGRFILRVQNYLMKAKSKKCSEASRWK